MFKNNLLKVLKEPELPDKIKGAVYITAPLFGGSMKIDNLTIEEKVGQMLMFAFNGTIYNKQIDIFIKEFKLGGVIYFKKNIENIHQVAMINNKISKKSKIPMFKALDQEGGPVLRFTEEITPLPGAMALAAAKADIYEICKRVGHDLKKIGFNMNFAPVGDVNNNPLNPVINSRAYSDKVEVVEESVVQAFKGFQKAKLLSTIKHFPGHGDTNVDSHIGLPVVDKTLEDINNLELKPFKRAFFEGIDGVMVSHMLYKQIDDKYPSTLSKKIITNLLKEQLGFKGLIVTDSLTMGAIWKNYTVEEIIKLGINAGNDILCFCGKALVEDQREIVKTFIKLVKNNEISIERVNESVEKILKYKEKYTNNENINLADLSKFVGKEEDVEFAKSISLKSITKVKDNNLIPVTKKDKILLISPEIKIFSLVDNEADKHFTLNKLMNVDEIIINELFNDYNYIKKLVKNYDKIIMSTYNVVENDYQVKVFNCLDKEKTIVTSMRSPYDILHLQNVKSYLCLYEATLLSFESLVKLIYGKENFTGILPVNI